MGIFMAIGIVFGDIGTSPLYVMKAILNGLPTGQQSNPDYIIGAISCIIWTLTLQTTVKYVIVTLRADNRGEGGILTLMSLAGRNTYAWVMDQRQADVFLTYCTNAVAAQAEVPRLRVVQLPAALQVGAVYGLTVRADAPAAALAFASALRQPPAQAVLQRLGFGLP